MSMYTDPNHIRIEDPGQVEGNMVFTYLDVFGKEKEYIEELKEHYRHGGLGDVKIKRYLIDVLEEELAPIRRRREELAKNPEAIMEMLHKGSLAAEKVAAQTLTEVKKRWEFNILSNKELEQVKRRMTCSSSFKWFEIDYYISWRKESELVIVPDAFPFQ